MEIPVIDFNELHGEKRSQTMALLDQACEQWGCFQIKNHGIDTEVMERVKKLVNTHYEENLKQQFYESEIAKSLERSEQHASDVDWESSFFIRHRPVSNMEAIQNLPADFCATVSEYVAQVITLAETLSELMCENLGLPKAHMKDAFAGAEGPSVGTKVAKYPRCPSPDLVRGLREHTDAGGIILLLQDDQVPGLQFLRGTRWVPVPPSADNTVFVNTGDQVEILSNGRYRSVLHRVMAHKEGSRLSIATFYNPAGDAVISPAPELVYPGRFRFRDYLELYAGTKFGDKARRFEAMKQRVSGNNGQAQ